MASKKQGEPQQVAREVPRQSTRKAPEDTLPCEGSSAATGWGSWEVTAAEGRSAARAYAREMAAEACGEKTCPGSKRCRYVETAIEIVEEAVDQDGLVVIYQARAKSSGRCECG
jgi:hypothetical protein